jgi:hypothetical protein
MHTHTLTLLRIWLVAFFYAQDIVEQGELRRMCMCVCVRLFVYVCICMCVYICTRIHV